MMKKNSRIGSTFEDWPDEQGVHKDVMAAAIEKVIAEEFAAKKTRDRLSFKISHLLEGHADGRFAIFALLILFLAAFHFLASAATR